MNNESKRAAIEKAFPKVIRCLHLPEHVFDDQNKWEAGDFWEWFDGERWKDCLNSDPLQDLNAVNQCEKEILARGLWHKYENALADVCLRDSAQDCLTQIYTIHASAPQRWDGILRTLGLWTE